MENRISIPDFVVNSRTPILTLSENLTWNITDYQIQELHKKGYKGQGIKVAVLDTGIVSHPDLSTVHVEDMTGTGPNDDHGHGTHVAGIIGALENDQGIRGIAPECELYIFKVISAKTGSIEHVVAGIDRAVEMGCQIINMSLGTTADVPILMQACARAAEKGVLLICASGNSGSESISYPGAYDSCIAVGSVNREKKVSAFTSFGQPLDVMAPGEKILSTYLGNGYAVLSGTSMAAPWMSGMCALLMSAGLQVDYKLIVDSTNDIKSPGFDHESGYGIFDPHKALLKLVPPDSPCETTKIAEKLDQAMEILREIREDLGS